MLNSPKDEVKSLKKSLEYVAKLITTAIIVVLLLIGAFLIYYLISAKIISKRAGVAPKISLYTIVSGSMSPAIKKSDIILNVRVDDFSTLKVGDVITFKSYNSLISDMTITHRIIDIKIKEDNTREFVTKGDYNLSADSAPIQEKDIIGKTVLKIPQLGQIQLLLATKMGWLFIVLIPALGIIIYDILKLFKVLGVTGKAENIEGSISEVVEKEENKKILETLEKIKKNPHLFTKKNINSSNETENIQPINENLETTDNGNIIDNQIKDNEINKKIFFENFSEFQKDIDINIENDYDNQTENIQPIKENLETIDNENIIDDQIKDNDIDINIKNDYDNQTENIQPIKENLETIDNENIIDDQIKDNEKKKKIFFENSSEFPNDKKD